MAKRLINSEIGSELKQPEGLIREEEEEKTRTERERERERQE
jgi:hypothetical protein